VLRSAPNVPGHGFSPARRSDEGELAVRNPDTLLAGSRMGRQ
jgi:hypothetical protein